MGECDLARFVGLSESAVWCMHVGVADESATAPTLTSARIVGLTSPEVEERGVVVGGVVDRVLPELKDLLLKVVNIDPGLKGELRCEGWDGMGISSQGIGRCGGN